VCVSERERERDRENESESVCLSERERVFVPNWFCLFDFSATVTPNDLPASSCVRTCVCVYVCMYVCVRERERERERERDTYTYIIYIYMYICDIYYIHIYVYMCVRKFISPSPSLHQKLHVSANAVDGIKGDALRSFDGIQGSFDGM